MSLAHDIGPLPALTSADRSHTACGYVLVGPTASGKTAVAHLLACQLRAAILSADSMLVYRGMDVGTAKPSKAERSEVSYFGIDVVPPTATYNVARYLECARQAWNFCVSQRMPLLVVGGTGLYVKCLTEGLSALPGSAPDVRSQAEQLLATKGAEGLFAALERLDPQRACRIKDRNNPRRLMRAFELAVLKAPISTGWSAHPSQPMAGLRWSARVLDQRIAERVRWQYKNGLLEETERLLKETGWSETARKAIGYAEAVSVLKKCMTVEEAMAVTIRRTRQLAKRQMTWFRHQANVHWLDIQPGETLEDVAKRVVATWRTYGSAVLHI